jgi:carboxyl-terminal processing protease
VIRILLIAALLGCGGATPPAAAPPPALSVIAKPREPSAAAVATAEAISHVYRLLTVESAVPADPKALREAAIDTLSPGGWRGDDLTWGDEPSLDAAVLRTAVLTLATRDTLPMDAVLRATRAMTLAANDTHTFALTQPAVQAQSALSDGGAVVQPGMLLHKLDDGRWAVSDVVATSPAAVAGVQRGDVVVSLDGIAVVHGWMDFVSLLGVPNGYEAVLVVERGGDKKGLVLRMAPVTQPILESKMFPGGIGYVRLWACTHSDDPARDAAKLLAATLADLDKKKAKKLVLDLRGNTSGFPFDIASLLVDADPLLLAITPSGAEQPVARTKLPAWKIKRRIVVLVNELTASGAEMIALALRDHAKAKIIGRPTAGGLTLPTIEKLSSEVTLSYPLSRVGSALTKVMLDGNRLVPDLPVANPSAEDYAAGKDPQLDAALAQLKAMR